MPTPPPFNLAIETSGRAGSIALGRGGELLGVAPLGEPRRHNLGLMPAVDALCREHGVKPNELDEVYVSLGPGSFTGLRVGITTAKMLALATGARVVGVPTLDTLAEAAAPGAVAVGLNFKRGTLYSAAYERGERVLDPALRTLEGLLAAAPRPVSLIAEKLPPDAALPDGVTLLPPEAATARAEVLWRLGRRLAGEGRFTDAADLSPLYVREPEAVTLWNERHGDAPRP